MKKTTLKKKLLAARKKAEGLEETVKELKGQLVMVKAENERLKAPPAGPPTVSKPAVKEKIPLKKQIKELGKEAVKMKTARKKAVKKRVIKKKSAKKVAK